MSGKFKVRRRFLQVGARRVHYLRAGEGPPVVLVHSSPANSWLLLPDIEYLSRHYTVFAFDTPGFGISEPLPLEKMIVADLADAMAETLAAIAMPPCPMFGTHSGAAIALEFGVRHPERVTGLVLDGVPAFTEAECAALFGRYFQKIPVSDLGGHYANVWTRFRDQSIWFPWSGRDPQYLNPYDLGAPESTHLWTSMYFEAADTYTPAYHATSHYGDRAIAAAAALTLPAVYTATTTDMLFPHLARLPALKPGQEIRDIGASYEAKRALILESFRRFGGAGQAPADAPTFIARAGVQRQFTDTPNGGQIHFRYAGDRNAKPLLLLHDAPGASATVTDLIEARGKTHFVIAPDLPGCGESDALPPTPTMADFADVLAYALDKIGVAATEVEGVGFGASVAVEFAARHAKRTAALALNGLLMPTPEERAALGAHYAPEIAITADGGHWYRTWLMLRDSMVWWPWFERKKTAQRKAPGDFDADRLHKWVLEVMRQRENYGDVIHAAFAHDATAALAQARAPITFHAGADTPLSAFDARWKAPAAAR